MFIRLFGNVQQGFGADLAGPVEDQVLEPAGKFLVTGAAAPGLVDTILRLDVNRDADGVGTQLAVDDKDRKLDALVRIVGKRIPVGNDGAAERVDIRDRQQRDYFKRRAPENGIHRNAAIIILVEITQIAEFESAGLAGQEGDRLLFLLRRGRAEVRTAGDKQACEDESCYSHVRGPKKKGGPVSRPSDSTLTNFY